MGATAAIGMAVAGGAVNANASMQSGQANQDLMNYNANVAEFQAEDAIARGREDETRHRQGTRRLMGSQRAAFAASGVAVDDPESSFADVTADTAKLSEIDALTIRANAQREAWGFRTQAQDMRFRGQIAKNEGKSRAVGEVLSTGGNLMYSKYGFGGTSRGRAGG